jgi:alpha-beta hydrolase superfamily lysophospholipase
MYLRLNIRKVKPELPISPRQADDLVAGRREDSKQLKSSSKAKLRSQDRRERKLHTTTPFPPFRHPMPKPWGHSSMMFHPYAPWFGWYALLM